MDCDSALRVCLNLMHTELCSSQEHLPRTWTAHCRSQSGTILRISATSDFKSSWGWRNLLFVIHEDSSSLFGRPILVTWRGVLSGFLGGVRVFSRTAVVCSLSAPAIDVITVADVLKTAPDWLRQCVVHVRHDPVLGRCSWEEQSSVCIRFRQTLKAESQSIDRTQMRSRICTMLNKLQESCWPENQPFGIEEIEFVGYHAYNNTDHQRLEGMITIEYRHRTPLEQDLQIGLLMAMYIGNDIPAGEEGCGLKWCPLRNEIGTTACTVTKVTTRRTTRGHCR